jgi:hypothetical protein
MFGIFLGDRRDVKLARIGPKILKDFFETVRQSFIDIF